MQAKSAIFTLYGAVAVMAFTGFFSKVIPADAASITQLRCGVALVGIFFFSLFLGRSLRLSSKKDALGVLILGVLMGLHWAAFFHSMQVSTIAIGMLSFYSYPLITVLMEPLFDKKGWHRADLFAGIIVTIGVIVLVIDFEGNKATGNYLLGASWGVLSAILMAVRNLFQKYHFAHISSSNLMFYQVLVIAVLGIPFVNYPVVSAFEIKDWAYLIALGLMVTAGGHTLLVLSLKHLPAKTVAMIGCSQPVLAVAIGWIALGEAPTLQVYIGGSIILAVALYESWRRSELNRSASDPISTV